jgi:FlaA1/EpsC-like NDP-sugar epimerase
MNLLRNFTPRMGLILAHDLVMTAVAVLASFYIRFEERGLAERWSLLVLLLPAFVVYSGCIFALFGLFKTKWRFVSVPDLFNIVRVSTVLAITLLGLDYVLLSPNYYGTYFFGKITILLYWFLQIFFLAASRVGYRYFRYTRTLRHAKVDNAAPVLVLGRAADTEVLLRAIESRSAFSRPRPPTGGKPFAALRCSATLMTSSASSPISARAAAPSRAWF